MQQLHQHTARHAAHMPIHKSYVERYGNDGSGSLFIVRTFDASGQACWFLLRTTERQLIRLKCTLREELIDLTQYGEVLDRGWGDPPADNLVA